MSTSDRTRIDEWKGEAIALGMKQKEANNHCSLITGFMVWLTALGEDFSTCDEDLCWAYQGYLLEKPHARTGEKLLHSTVISHMYRLRSFGDWLVKKGYAPVNPFRAVVLVQSVHNPPFGLLKEEEMGLFLAALMDWESETDVRQCMWAYRVHVMAEVQYATGLRMSELGSLVESDLDLARFEVRVRCGKGGKDRIAYLTVWAASLLREYMTLRHLVVKGGEKSNRYLFGPAGENLMRAYNKRLNIVGARLGYGRFYSHKFRHELGYHLMRAHCPIRSIQGILGHEKLSSTEIYTKVDAEDVRDILDTCHPRSA